MPAHLAVELYLSARPKGAAVHRRALVIQALSVLASEAAPAGADGDAPISDLVELFRDGGHRHGHPDRESRSSRASGVAPASARLAVAGQSYTEIYGLPADTMIV